MNEREIQTIIADIQASPKESEWVEVKENNYVPETIGEYVSALANGAAYMGQSKGYLAFGITCHCRYNLFPEERKNWQSGNRKLDCNATFAPH